MSNEVRAARAYEAMMDGTAIRAAFQARKAAMLARAGTTNAALVALDAELTALFADAATYGFDVPTQAEAKDYRVFTRQIWRADAALPWNTLVAEFGALMAFWTSRGLQGCWLSKIGYVIFDIPEPTMDHALLIHLAYAEAAHTGFSPAPNGSPTASAPGDTSSDGISATPPHSDHRHARESFGSAPGTVCQGNDPRLSDARTPTAHKTSHEPGGGDAMTVDAAAGVGSLRTLGTTSTKACAGDDSRLSDARTPTAHKTSHEPGGGDAMAVDAAAGTGSLRTLGTGATTACSGADSRLSDARTPTVHGDDKHNTRGTSFPASPATGDRFFHLSYNMAFYWNGSNWVSEQIFSTTLSSKRTMPFSSNDTIAVVPRLDFIAGIFIRWLDVSAWFEANQTVVNYWTFILERFPDASATPTTIWQWDSGIKTKWLWHKYHNDISAVYTGSDQTIALRVSKTGAAGEIEAHAVLYFQIIGADPP